MSTPTTIKQIYDPFKFIGTIRLVTIAIVGSFVTMKFLNALYENLYEPTIDIIVDSKNTDKYYVKIGEYQVQIDVIFKEFIKWIILVILLMIIYNLFPASQLTARR